MTEPAAYIPPLRFHALTRFYDTLVRWTTREATIKERLLQAALPADAILDLGAGTGTLVKLIKSRCPGARVVGLDLDRQALAIARDKLSTAGLDVELVHGDVLAPPFPPESFDCIASSLLFHHLTSEQKVAVLRAARSLLRPGGQLVLADWSSPASRLQRALFLIVQLLDGFETTRDHVTGEFPRFLHEAGFSHVRQSDRLRTPLGTMALFRARP